MKGEHDKFEIITNPLEDLRARFEAAGIIFYPVKQVPLGSQTIFFDIRTSELLGDSSGETDASLRRDMDNSQGPTGWAVTPSTREDPTGSAHWVDIVTVVHPERLRRLPSYMDRAVSTESQLGQEAASQTLKVIRSNSDTVD